MARKLKQTKKARAARARYRRNKAKTRARGRGRGRGRGRRCKGANRRGGDFWGDVGNFFTHTVPDTVMNIAPMILTAL